MKDISWRGKKEGEKEGKKEEEEGGVYGKLEGR